MAAGAAKEEDRLSGLPDDVLLSIIGRVPFKQAVRTNALSRRWPRLWIHGLAASGVLDFTDRGFVRSQSRAHIVATVNRCLRVRGGRAPVDVLRVSLSPFGAFERDVVGWIAAALRRGAREVDVNLTLDAALTVNYRADQLELPGDLFCAESSLARLSLGRCSLCNVPPGAPGLAGLTSLSLNHVDITDDAVRDMVSACRLLEFLSLRRCHLLAFVRIAGEKLRGLEVVGCLDVRQLQVAAPALESFAFHGDILYFKYREDDSVEFEPVEFIGKGNTKTPSEATPRLRDAYLSHIGFGVYDDPIHDFAYSNLMEKVAHAKILTICSVGLLHIEETCNFYELMMETQNLQELQLLMDSMGDDDVTRISAFFQLTAPPLLERLFIRLPAACDDAEDSRGGTTAIGKDEDIVLYFEIALDHLTFIKLVNFRGTRREMRLLRFVLRRAPVLEQLVLVTPEEEGRTNLGLGHDDQNQQLLKIVQEHVSEIEKAFLWREAHVVVCRPREDCSRSPAHTKYYHDD